MAYTQIDIDFFNGLFKALYGQSGQELYNKVKQEEQKRKQAEQKRKQEEQKRKQEEQKRKQEEQKVVNLVLNLYLTEKMSIKQIASISGETQATIEKIIKERDKEK